MYDYNQIFNSSRFSRRAYLIVPIYLPSKTTTSTMAPVNMYGSTLAAGLLSSR